MSRIEFFGSVGAGKSTIYRACLKQRGQLSGSPLTRAEFRLALARRAAHDRPSLSDLLHRGLLYLPWPSIRQRGADFLLAETTDWLPSADRDRWDDFLSAMAPAVASLPASVRITKEMWLLGAVKDAMFLDHHARDQLVVIDEGVLKRALALLVPRMAEVPLPDLTVPLNSIPVHATYIHVTAPHALIVERCNQRRNEARSGMTHWHRPQLHGTDLSDYVERQIEASGHAESILRQAGAHVIRVDSSQALNITVQTIYSGLGLS